MTSKEQQQDEQATFYQPAQLMIMVPSVNSAGTASGPNSPRGPSVANAQGPEISSSKRVHASNKNVNAFDRARTPLRRNNADSSAVPDAKQGYNNNTRDKSTKTAGDKRSSTPDRQIRHTDDPDAHNMSIFNRLQERNRSFEQLKQQHSSSSTINTNPHASQLFKFEIEAMSSGNSSTGGTASTQSFIHITNSNSHSTSNTNSNNSGSGSQQQTQPQPLTGSRSQFYREQNELAASNLKRYLKQRRDSRQASEASQQDDVSVSTATPPPASRSTPLQQNEKVSNSNSQQQQHKVGQPPTSTSVTGHSKRERSQCRKDEPQRGKRKTSSSPTKKDRDRLNATVTDVINKLKGRKKKKKSQSPAKKTAEELKNELSLQLFEKIKKKRKAANRDESISEGNSSSTDKPREARKDNGSLLSVVVGSNKSSSTTLSPGNTVRVGAKKSPRVSPRPSPRSSVVVTSSTRGTATPSPGLLSKPLRSDLSLSGPTPMRSTLPPEEAEQTMTFDNEKRKSLQDLKVAEDKETKTTKTRDSSKRRLDATKETKKTSTPPKKRSGHRDGSPKKPERERRTSPAKEQTAAPPRIVISPAKDSPEKRKRKVARDSPGGASSSSSQSTSPGTRRRSLSPKVSPKISLGLVDLVNRAMKRDERLLELQRRREANSGAHGEFLTVGKSNRPSSRTPSPNSSVRDTPPKKREPSTQLQRNMTIFKKRVHDILGFQKDADSGKEQRRARKKQDANVDNAASSQRPERITPDATSSPGLRTPRDTPPRTVTPPGRDDSPGHRRSVNKCNVVVGLSPFSEKTREMRRVGDSAPLALMRGVAGWGKLRDKYLGAARSRARTYHTQERDHSAPAYKATYEPRHETPPTSAPTTPPSSVPSSRAWTPPATVEHHTHRTRATSAYTHGYSHVSASVQIALIRASSSRRQAQVRS